MYLIPTLPLLPDQRIQLLQQHQHWLSGTTQTTTNLSWSGAIDNVAVIGYDVYKDGALLGSTASLQAMLFLV
jgi:hypothetical protein